MCNRAFTCLMWTHFIHEGEEPQMLYQDHYYAPLDEPGEYKKEVCLQISPNKLRSSVIFPFVEFAANRIDYAKKDPKDGGIKRLIEINVTRPFHQASLS